MSGLDWVVVVLGLIVIAMVGEFLWWVYNDYK